MGQKFMHKYIASLCSRYINNNESSKKL